MAEPLDLESCGLTVDMLDVDWLRKTAYGLLLNYGSDLNVPHAVSRLQTLATCLEKAIRDIGQLRAELLRLRTAQEHLIQQHRRQAHALEFGADSRTLTGAHATIALTQAKCHREFADELEALTGCSPVRPTEEKEP